MAAYQGEYVERLAENVSEGDLRNTQATVLGKRARPVETREGHRTGGP
jgi:hypothetical protein